LNDADDARSQFNNVCVVDQPRSGIRGLRVRTPGTCSRIAWCDTQTTKGESMYIGVGAVVLILIVLLLIGVLR
jgi:hypothetical protein